MTKKLCCLFVFICFFPMHSSVAEHQLARQKSIYLIDNQQGRTHIADIHFTDASTQTHYQIEFSEENFQQEFLSMRPFQCLHKSSKIICHFEYLYEKNNIITEDDLMALEYDLLFLHKTPEEYGINAWNGLYYRLSHENGDIRGELMEVDLNVLTSPPKNGITRPISYDMLHPIKAGHHEYPYLSIE